jgi:hypothetical protein
VDVEAEEEVDVEEQLRQLTASAESDAADDAVTPASFGWIGTGFEHSSAPRRQTLTASALTKKGIVGVLRRVFALGAQLKGLEFRARVEDSKKAAKVAGADLPTMEAAVRKQTATQEKEALAARKGNARMATFGGSALEVLAKAPKSQPPVPQAATGYWNLDGATDVEKGGQLTKAVVALECEARGLPVKRWPAGTKNAGEVHGDEKVAGLIERLKVSNGGSARLKKATDEDGELKTSSQLEWNAAPSSASPGLSPPAMRAAAVVTNMEEVDEAAAEEAAGGTSPIGASPSATPDAKRSKKRGGAEANKAS